MQQQNILPITAAERIVLGLHFENKLGFDHIKARRWEDGVF